LVFSQKLGKEGGKKSGEQKEKGIHLPEEDLSIFKKGEGKGSRRSGGGEWSLLGEKGNIENWGLNREGKKRRVG